MGMARFLWWAQFVSCVPGKASDGSSKQIVEQTVTSCMHGRVQEVKLDNTGGTRLRLTPFFAAAPFQRRSRLNLHILTRVHLLKLTSSQ